MLSFLGELKTHIPCRRHSTTKRALSKQVKHQLRCQHEQKKHGSVLKVVLLGA
jgi:hypothetical protein